MSDKTIFLLYICIRTQRRRIWSADRRTQCRPERKMRRMETRHASPLAAKRGFPHAGRRARRPKGENGLPFPALLKTIRFFPIGYPPGFHDFMKRNFLLNHLCGKLENYPLFHKVTSVPLGILLKLLKIKSSFSLLCGKPKVSFFNVQNQVRENC